jgi:hypothetical protein
VVSGGRVGAVGMAAGEAGEKLLGAVGATVAVGSLPVGWLRHRSCRR